MNLEVWGRIDSTHYGWACSTQIWTRGEVEILVGYHLLEASASILSEIK